LFHIKPEKIVKFCFESIVSISQTQKGFLKGRSIGECTRLIFDLIEKMEEDDIPGLLVLLDFEKAFDTVYLR
jgi:hypothetical protein